MSELEVELEDDLKVCCGPTSDVLEHFRKTLSILKRRHEASGKTDGSYEKTYEELDTHLGMKEHPEVAYVYLYFLNELDLIEHGSGIRGSWPTDTGKRTLTKLEAWAAERALREKK